MHTSFVTPDLPNRSLLAADLHRPHYHFVAPANWLNDPNGMIDWDGTFHLFYQYNPNGPFHGTIHWGHASSDDLVHWRDHPIALAPTPGGPDAEGCWSGCAVDNNGTPTLVYTGVNPQTVSLAMSTDDLESWQKYAGNPVIAAPPEGIAAQCDGDFRDPYVWRENSEWWMVIGAQRKGVGGLVLLYRSPDLKQWVFVRVLLAGDEQASPFFYEGAMWECPNLLDFGERRALIVSVQDAAWRLRHAAYFSGLYRNHEFTPDTGGVLAYGHSFYAPQATRMSDGRTLLFGWLRETRPLEASMAAGWNGCMSLPLIVTMQDNGALSLAPAPELEALRGEEWTISDLPLAPHTQQRLAIAGDALEIGVTFEADPIDDYGIAVRCSPDGAEQTRIVVRPEQGELRIEHVGVDPAASPESLPLAPDQPLNLRIFVDGSVLEVFTGDGRYLATRCYPQRTDSLGVTLFATGAPVDIKHLSAWPLTSVW
ncbi:MAG: glycoside hydrolase family 32 protein [Caldilinea sp.]